VGCAISPSFHVIPSIKINLRGDSPGVQPPATRSTMFESRRQKLIPRARFIRRLVKSLAVAFLILSMALVIGVVGYHYLAGLPWIDALLNASMILTGMGPVDPLRGNGAKLFATAYALFSGLVFITTMTIALAPVFHRVLHKFHVDEKD